MFIPQRKSNYGPPGLVTEMALLLLFAILILIVVGLRGGEIQNVSIESSSGIILKFSVWKTNAEAREWHVD
jgi:hypothetical protein